MKNRMLQVALAQADFSQKQNIRTSKIQIILDKFKQAALLVCIQLNSRLNRGQQGSSCNMKGIVWRIYWKSWKLLWNDELC